MGTEGDMKNRNIYGNFQEWGHGCDTGARTGMARGGMRQGGGLKLHGRNMETVKTSVGQKVT